MPKSRFTKNDIVNNLDDDISLIETSEDVDKTIESYKGKDEVKGFVKDIYKNIKTLYGIYDPNRKSKIGSVFLICVITLFVATPFGLIIWNLIAHKFEWWVNLVLFAFGVVFCGFAISFLKDYLSTKFKSHVYFYKIGNKTVTVYKQIKDKHITVYLDKNNVFRKYKNGEWLAINYDEDEMMGNDLLFSKLKRGKLNYEERKNGEQIICLYLKELRKKITVMHLKDGVLQSIEHCKLHYDEYRPRINAVDLLTVLEINTMRSCDIPKSFLGFCDSNGIDFPKENEYLYFV